MSWTEPLIGVGLVMVLLFGTAWAVAGRKNGWRRFAARFGNKRQNPRLTLVERLPLTTGHSLHLIELDGRNYLVATHPQGASITSAGSPASFPQLFAKAAGEDLQ